MFDQSFAFNNSWYLAWLAIVPLLAGLSYRSLSGLGRYRRWLAIGLRCFVVVLFILALAEMQHQQTSDRGT